MLNVNRDRGSTRKDADVLLAQELREHAELCKALEQWLKLV